MRSELRSHLQGIHVISEAFITCAITGAGDADGRSKDVLVTPEQIAHSALEAARAGAAVVHIHAQDPDAGRGAPDPALLRAVMERIRSVSDIDPVLNLTAGTGGDVVPSAVEAAPPVDPVSTELAEASRRLAHVEELLPEICTLHCARMDLDADGDHIVADTLGMLRAMACRTRELGVRPELEVFDTRHLVLVHALIEEGLIDHPSLIRLCLGLPYGSPADVATLLAMVAQLPRGAVFSAFAIGRLQLPYAALAPIVGANVRVGLEDNLGLPRGRPATNAELVERVVALLDAMNVRVLGPDEVREKLSLRARG
jgi:uncharacterized protein (DUF849 family)